jgi:DNA polymerase-1
MANDLDRNKTFRRKLYKGYKAQRKPMDQDIVEQMRIISQLCALLGYPFINNETYEADDILGMVSRFGADNNMDTIIASSDRDMYQLINDSTFIFSPKNKELLDLNWLQDNYRLTPEQWIELKMLQGDRSDNIPGIHGVGEATALKLMQQFKSIDGIYSHMGYHKPALREVLTNGKDSLDLTRELVTIITDYTKINLTEDNLKRKEVYEDEIYNLIKELEIFSLINVMRYSLISNENYNDTYERYVS